MTKTKVMNFDFDEIPEERKTKRFKKLKETKLDSVWSKFSHEHPYISFILFITGLPLCSLLAVVGAVFSFIAPIALFMGWF